MQISLSVFLELSNCTGFNNYLGSKIFSDEPFGICYGFRFKQGFQTLNLHK